MFRVACRRGTLEAAQLLLNAGAEMDLRDDGGTTALMALMEAAFDGHEEIAQFLLQADAEEDSQDQYGETALMRAARKGHVSSRVYLRKRAEEGPRWYFS